MAMMAYKPTAIFSPTGARVDFERVVISINLTPAQAEEVSAATGQHHTALGLTPSDIKLVLMPREILKEWGPASPVPS